MKHPRGIIDLRFDLRSNEESGILESLVVFLIGVERRIEADEVNTLVLKDRHNLKAIIVIERVGGTPNVHSPLVGYNMRIKEYPFLWV